MQKIIILNSNYEPSQFPKSPDKDDRFYTYGFGGTIGKIFSKYLKEYEIEVWRLDSYCSGKYFEKKIDNIKFKIYRSKNMFKLGGFSKSFISDLKEEAKKSNPILFVIHTHNWQTYQIAFFLKKYIIITTHHGDWSPFFLYKTSSGLTKLKAWMGIIAEKHIMKYINFFLICDHKQIPYIKKVAPDSGFEIFSTGLDINRFKVIKKDEARKILGWELEKKYILYVGKLYIYKQVDDLIKMWADIKKKRPEVELILVGNEDRNSWGEEFYQMAEDYGATIVGRVLNTELYKYYCASDVYVLIALREDNFGGTGIAPLESLACNTPVVNYSMVNYLGNNAEEICERPKTLKEYKEAILKVLDHPEKYKNMRESVAKYYSWKTSAKRVDYVFKNLLKQK